MRSFWRLGPKIYSVVILLSVFTAAIGVVAITSFQTIQRHGARDRPGIEARLV